MLADFQEASHTHSTDTDREISGESDQGHYTRFLRDVVWSRYRESSPKCNYPPGNSEEKCPYIGHSTAYVGEEGWLSAFKGVAVSVYIALINWVPAIYSVSILRLNDSRWFIDQLKYRLVDGVPIKLRASNTGRVSFTAKWLAVVHRSAII